MENNLYTSCLRCGRPLKNKESRKIGLGSTCQKKLKEEFEEANREKERPNKRTEREEYEGQDNFLDELQEVM